MLAWHDKFGPIPHALPMNLPESHLERVCPISRITEFGGVLGIVRNFGAVFWPTNQRPAQRKFHRSKFASDV